MPLFLQIVDDNGHPQPTEALGDVLVDALMDKGVGLFKTSGHVSNDLRQVIRELLREKVVVLVHEAKPEVIQVSAAPQVSSSWKESEICQNCGKTIAIWHVLQDGSIRCTDCK